MITTSSRPARVVRLLLLGLAATAAVAPPAPAQPTGEPDGPGGRRAVDGGMVELGFRQKPIDEKVLAFIADTTGKMVMPVGDLMTDRAPRITLLSGPPIERGRALDMIFRSLRLQGIGVIEKEDVVIIGRVEELMRLKRAPVLGADVDIMGRRDKSSLVFKVYRLREVAAEAVGARLEEQLPEGAQMTVDPDSNQIVLCGDIAACQQVQQLLDELDENRRRAETWTFRLEYADAAEIAAHIEQLFPVDEASGTGPARGARRAARAPRSARPGDAGRAPGTEVPVRIAVSVQQNSVTVLADPETVARIADLVEHAWDLPRPFGTSKVYELEHTDPVKMRDIIREVLGVGSGSGSRTRVRGGGEGDVTETLSGIYRFEAFTDKNALVAICKTEEAFDFLDDLVAKLDRPSTLGLPVKISLRHADAGRLAQEINALLAPGSASLRLAERGLRGGGLAAFLGDGAGGAGFGAGAGADGEAGAAGEIDLPWRDRPRDIDADRAPESNLIGNVRVVPIVRENALAVLAPPAHLAAMRELVEAFDQPSRQVMVSATIAEVELTDDLVLGLRLSAGDLALSTAENTLAARLSGSAGETGFLGGLFETSVLDADFDVSVALQALAGHTDVRVLHEPRIFTSDNEEAYFFDGQQVPFISDSNNFESGVNQSFDYRPVGLLLDVRPHITARRDVDLEVSIELSSVVPGQTAFGGFVLDQRQARTNVTLSDGQTVVISGLLREEESQIVRKVPLLGDLPLLGELFKSRENGTRSTELLVFLTPHVLDGTAETREHVRPDLEQLETLARPLDEQPPHEERRDDLRRRLLDR